MAVTSFRALGLLVLAACVGSSRSARVFNVAGRVVKAASKGFIKEVSVDLSAYEKRIGAKLTRTVSLPLLEGNSREPNAHEMQLGELKDMILEGLGMKKEDIERDDMYVSIDGEDQQPNEDDTKIIIRRRTKEIEAALYRR
eukprot:TRINITY_DN73397_c0_g1_i1.p1 TRINITY_DN73397_c0_g1~~TRINITY_DN73397_c0_g1_i1.p1  ORF type:complete len:163 (+),score=30.31 TRINITY_DN73397_c0_g1_i1:69-491(+)